MSTTGQYPDMPHLESVEADPAYDYAEDVPISVDDWDAEEVVVPTPPVAVDAEERVVPLDEDEFRGTE
ncbi:hypothetical protein [Pseudarthrobacter sp. NBSH8]|uniref:hypothetical protein n=1 Tax=Pseudarthrobacter sp. NBSH8 TaxID=2596911 RepID=UPI0016265D14|nr:hypothetical protein [Pseudarthrobacter sp. NBSH8]QNE13695.1 hypothetical protein FYJ92_03885 [Pseudarthrobacter sp. NBSH8]